MKKIVLFIGVFSFLSGAASSYAADGTLFFDSTWNWNEGNSTVAGDSVTGDLSLNKSGIIKGITGLDGIAKAGECYTAAYVEETCSKASKRVMVAPAYDETEPVLAVSKYITKKVIIEQEKTVEEFTPALYENVSKKILVKAEHTVWKKGNFSAIQKIVDNETYCLVTVPASYKEKMEKVLKVPASSKIRTIPAVYKTVKEKVVITPATTRVIKRHPAEYKVVSGCINSKAGHYEWRSILCEQNATTSVLRNFEKALAKKGFLTKSHIDGNIDDVTVDAIKAYQRKSGLKVDGLVNVETVKLLGVKY